MTLLLARDRNQLKTIWSSRYHVMSRSKSNRSQLQGGLDSRLPTAPQREDPLSESWTLYHMFSDSPRILWTHVYILSSKGKRKLHLNHNLGSLGKGLKEARLWDKAFDAGGLFGRGTPWGSKEGKTGMGEESGKTALVSYHCGPLEFSPIGPSEAPCPNSPTGDKEGRRQCVTDPHPLLAGGCSGGCSSPALVEHCPWAGQVVIALEKYLRF